MGTKKAVTIGQLWGAAQCTERLQEQQRELTLAKDLANTEFKELLHKASSKTVKEFVLKFNGGNK